MAIIEYFEDIKKEDELQKQLAKTSSEQSQTLGKGRWVFDKTKKSMLWLSDEQIGESSAEL